MKLRRSVTKPNAIIDFYQHLCKCSSTNQSHLSKTRSQGPLSLCYPARLASWNIKSLHLYNFTKLNTTENQFSQKNTPAKRKFESMSQRELRTAFRLDIADATGIIGNLFRLTRASVCTTLYPPVLASYFPLSLLVLLLAAKPNAKVNSRIWILPLCN